MRIPARYYDRIPVFYFIVGTLLLANSIYMGLNNLAAYVYCAFGTVSILYAMSVHMARARRRKKASAEMEGGEQSEFNDFPEDSSRESSSH